MGKDISIKFISEKSGFAPSTVSRVMNGNAREYRISEETEEKILKVAKKYDYRPNPVAVNLRVKKSYTIGLVIPTLKNPFFVNVTEILNRELSKMGYNIILTESYDDVETEGKMIEQLLERNIDGLFIIPCEETDQNAEMIEKAFDNGVPILCIDRYINNSSVPYIITDNEKAAYDGTQFLIDKGHKKIACIQGLKNATPTIDRKRGFKKALRDKELSPMYIGGNAFSVECGKEQAFKILDEVGQPDAIFAMSSTIALGVMEALNETGYMIPDDISLIGFDDNVFLDYLSTPLTTIAQPIQDISEIAVNALINHIDGNIDLKDWDSRMLDTQIIERKSVA